MVVKRKLLKSQLVEAYKSLGESELRILKEWELASSEIEQDR